MIPQNNPLVPDMLQRLFPNVGKTVSISATSERKIGIQHTSKADISNSNNTFMDEFQKGLLVEGPTNFGK